VSTGALREILLNVIRRTAGYVREHEDDFVERVREMSAFRKSETAKTHTRLIAKNEKRIAELDKLFRNLYEDKVSGVLTAERFAQMTAGYEREQTELREKNAALQTELDAFNEDSARAGNFIALVRKYTRFEELTNAMINEFVDKIVVHESVWSEQTETARRMGERSQKIDVYLKYIGDLSVPDTRPPEEIEAERIAEEKAMRLRAQKRESNRRRRNAAKKRAAETEPAA
jgi:hypothetical protein